MRQDVAMFRRWPHTMGLMLVALVAPFLAGCPQPTDIPPGPAPKPEVTVSVYRLAQDLRLAVTERTATYVRLTNADNDVFIYPDPQGQVFVNRRRIGSRGGIRFYRGELFIPISLEPQIRQYLVTTYTPPGPPVIPRQGTGPTEVLARVGHGHIMIDAGHGGPDGGARSVLGYNEKGVNLDVALRLARYLQYSRVIVSMTRNNDTFVELDERAAMSNRAKVDLFVAIHADSAERASAYGFTVYMSRSAGAQSRAAAAAIERSMRAAGFNSWGVRQAGYRVLVKNERPAVLVELGFLSNRAEAARLNSPSERDAYARALADGIIHYLKGAP